MKFELVLLSINLILASVIIWRHRNKKNQIKQSVSVKTHSELFVKYTKLQDERDELLNKIWKLENEQEAKNESYKTHKEVKQQLVVTDDNFEELLLKSTKQGLDILKNDTLKLRGSELEKFLNENEMGTEEMIHTIIKYRKLEEDLRGEISTLKECLGDALDYEEKHRKELGKIEQAKQLDDCPKCTRFRVVAMADNRRIRKLEKEIEDLKIKLLKYITI